MNPLQHVHPPFWWSGMKYSKIQLLLHGPGIGHRNMHLRDAQGVYLTSWHSAPNPNYLLAYIETKEAPAQTLHFVLWQEGQEDIVLDYELREREHQNIDTFDASDVVYLLMPDRWIMGDTPKKKKAAYAPMKESTWQVDGIEQRHGGDLAGMRKGLRYLQQLGVTAIWPTCMLENDNSRLTYHGYAITDHYAIDPRLGTNEAYRAWVTDANKRGLKVIMDMVFNHCSRQCFLFEDRISDGWFCLYPHFTRTNYKTQTLTDPYASHTDFDLTTRAWFDTMMPSFAGTNPQVAQYLTQSSLWWIEYAGISGIRMDTYPYNDWQQMAEWCQVIEREHPGFNVVGETWNESNITVSQWQKDSKLAAPRNSHLPSVMDFPLFTMLNGVCDEETDDWFTGLARIANYLSQDAVYADPHHLLIFLANHDVNRFASTEEKARSKTRYRQALTLLLTLRGIPQLYYGDELCMVGEKDSKDDGQRQNFLGGFPGDKANALTGKGLTLRMKQHLALTRQLLVWRKRPDINPIIARGDTIHYNTRSGIYVYARRHEGRTITVILNGTSRTQTLHLDTFREVIPSDKALEVLTGKLLDFSSKTRKIKPHDVLLLEWK